MTIEKPQLKYAVQKTNSRASDYNENFNKMLDYVESAVNTVEHGLEEAVSTVKNKAEKDLSNVIGLTPVIVITEFNKTGSRWYYVFDNKWCVQGGVSNAGTITFTKPFIDSTATVVGTNVGSISSTGFKLGTNGSWVAMGYIA